jgi:DNA-binding PadR family transcriptional regulator
MLDMRRKVGSLVPLEVSILDALVELRLRAVPESHGYLIAGTIREREGARRLTAYGTLYKALDRLEAGELLESRWEDPLVAAADGRPRRRYYRITLEGETARAAARAGRTIASPALRGGAATR